MADGTPLVGHAPGQRAPEDEAGCVARYTFWWSFPHIMSASRQGYLELQDLPALPEADSPAGLFARFTASWTASAGTQEPRLLRRLLWSTQRKLLLTSLFNGYFSLFCQTVNPVFLQALLASISTAQVSTQLEQGFGLVGVMTACLLGRVACKERCWHTSTRVMNNARAITNHCVFRRALMGPRGSEHDVGSLTNYMATDSDKLGKQDGLIDCLSQVTWGLLSMPVVVIALVQLIGVAATLLATATTVLGIWANKALANSTQPRVQKVQEVRDERARLMSELVQGIRTVKLQVWERMWYARIMAVREKEMRLLVTVSYLNALNQLLGSLLSLAVPTVIFAWHTVVNGKVLDSTTAFTTLAWLALLQSSFNSLPWAYGSYVNMIPSVERLARFFSTPSRAEQQSGSRQDDVELTVVSGEGEAQAEAWLRLGPQAANYVPAAFSGQPVLALQNATLSQSALGQAAPQDSPPPRAAGPPPAVSLEIYAGELVLVAGLVGCGKSTLLAALAGARPLLSGTCEARGGRAYATQEPFLLNATIRENITFTKEFDADRYADVLRRVALGPDLAALARGDATPVGEHGVQLSGGQKARVALARALYSDADVVVCDDVLSAVDAHTAKHVWEEALVGGLTACGRAVVLATHQVQYLSRPEVSRVVVLQEGSIKTQAPWSRLAEGDKDQLLSLVGTWELVPATAAAGPKPAAQAELPEVSDSDVHDLGLGEAVRAVGEILQQFEGQHVSPALVEEVLARLGGRSEERPHQGNIAWSDFRVYLTAFGSPALVLLLATAAVAAGVFGIMGNIWLSVWTSHEDPDRQPWYLTMYIGIGVANGLCGTVQAFILTHCALRASRRVHRDMLQRLLDAPLSFFNRTKTGNIHNRFLQDLDNIDNFVPSCIMAQVNKTLNIVAQLSLIYVAAPWVLVSLPILAVPYFEVYSRVKVANRDTKRIEATAHSPVYAHFGDALHGRETIRAFGVEEAFVGQNLRLIEGMSLGKYGNQAVGKWAQATVSQWGCLLFLICGITCVCLGVRGQMSSSQVGLLLLYASNLNGALTDYLVGTAVLEAQFVSVERAAEYMRLPRETGCDLGDAEDSVDRPASVPPLSVATWLMEGAISIKGVHLRYATHLPYALSGIDLEVPSRAKVALCGRTGCGKSSLLGVLTRLYPAAGGQVLLDGRDITQVPLRELRRVLRVVAQDTFLVSGTVAENLDFEHSGGCGVDGNDQEQSGYAKICWQVLDMVGMTERITQAGGLAARVEDGGSNFSVGERQLLALARALMPPCAGEDAHQVWHPPPVLLCDEPTANVDMVADQRVHDVLLGLDSTLVMICHRLQYISRFDLVAVLGGGKVLEHGTPGELLAASTPRGFRGTSPPSRLTALCAEAGVLERNS